MSVYLWHWTEAGLKVEKKLFKRDHIQIDQISVFEKNQNILSKISLSIYRNGRCIDVDECSTGLAVCFMGRVIIDIWVWSWLFGIMIYEF